MVFDGLALGIRVWAERVTAHGGERSSPPLCRATEKNAYHEVYHEAGHAVIAMVLPEARDPKKIEIRADESDRTELDGELPPQDQVTAAQAEREAIATLAGLEAETLIGAPWNA